MTVDALALPLAVLAIGAVIGFFLILRAGKSDNKDVAEQGKANDLHFAQKAVLAELHALEMQKEKLSKQDYALERKSLLSHGAEALRRIEKTGEQDIESTEETEEMGMKTADGDDSQSKGSPTAMEVLKQNREAMGEAQYQAALAALKAGPVKTSWISPRWEGALWAFGILTVFSGLYVALYFGGDLLPDEEAPKPNPTAQQLVGPDEKEWEDALAKDPNHIEALNKLSWFEFRRRNNLDKAWEYNERARAIDSTNPDARFHHGLFLYLKRMPALAFKTLDALIEEHPDHVKALELRGLFYVEDNRFEEGRALVVRAEKAAPDGQSRVRIRQLLQSIERREQAFKENDAVVVAGTITLKTPLSQDLGPKAVVFLSLRDPAGGPPVAAKKLPVGPFPLAFRVTGNDRIGMGGQRPIPDAFKLSIRVDADGNAMTREPGLPERVYEEMSKGTEDLSVELDVPNRP